MKDKEQHLMHLLSDLTFDFFKEICKTTNGENARIFNGDVQVNITDKDNLKVMIYTNNFRLMHGKITEMLLVARDEK